MAALPSPVSRRARRWRRAVRGAALAAGLAICALPAAAVRAQRPEGGLTPPRRIVSFVPAVTEMLFAMGAGDRVVGVTAYDRFPEAVRSLPQVGGLLDPQVERVISLRPDLVIVYATQRDLQAQLDRAAIPRFEYVHRDLADVLATTRTVGRRIGAGPAGERLAAEVERRLAAVRARVAGRPRPATLLVFGREAGSLRRIQASGGYGFLHDLVELAGGSNVMRDVRRESVEMSTEGVLARAPAAIVELRYGSPLAPAAVRAVAEEWRRVPGVPAVRDGRVLVLVGDEFVVPGPRVALAAERLAAVLHP